LLGASEYMKYNNDLGIQAMNLIQSIKACLDDKLLIPLKYIQRPDVLDSSRVVEEEIEIEKYHINDTLANDVVFRILWQECLPLFYS
jgi:hypothetical protein